MVDVPFLLWEMKMSSAFRAHFNLITLIHIYRLSYTCRNVFHLREMEAGFRDKAMNEPKQKARESVRERGLLREMARKKEENGVFVVLFVIRI